MTARVFLDTNLWIYFFTKKLCEKALAVAGLIAAHSTDSSLLMSTQVLGEIYHVLARKTSYTKEECQNIIQDLDRAFSPIASIDTATVFKALEISDRYSFSYWDSLILATALLNDCEILYSEDMQHNMNVFDQLQIKNPFIA